MPKTVANRPQKKTDWIKMAKTAWKAGKAGWKVGKRLAKSYKSTKQRPQKRQKKSYKESIVRSPPDGLSNSTTVIRSKQMPKMPNIKILAGVCNYKSVQQGSITGAIGKQGVGTLYNGRGASNWLAAIAAVNSNLPATLPAQPPVANATSTKVYLQSLTSKYVITNQSPQTCILYLYDNVNKKDLLTGASHTSSSAWTQGLVDQQGIITQSIYHWDNQPTETKFFNQQYKIWKKRRIELGPGRSHEHICYLKINKIVDTELLELNENLRFIGYEQMFIIHGLPVDDTNNQSASTTVTIAASKVDYVANHTYKFRYIQQTPRDNYWSTQLPTTMAHQYFQTEDTNGVPDAGVSTEYA
nr:MAG: capsid protein [Cressdnaviricota sp.]